MENLRRCCSRHIKTISAISWVTLKRIHTPPTSRARLHHLSHFALLLAERRLSMHCAMFHEDETNYSYLCTKTHNYIHVCTFRIKMGKTGILLVRIPLLPLQRRSAGLPPLAGGEPCPGTARPTAACRINRALALVCTSIANIMV